MSHFYGQMKGNRSEVTRQGTKDSGMVAHLRGWGIGARVELIVNADGLDEVRVYSTAGSDGNGEDKLLATLTEGRTITRREAPKVKVAAE